MALLITETTETVWVAMVVVSLAIEKAVQVEPLLADTSM